MGADLPEADREQVERAAEVLRAGGLVGFPTETVYGLGADAENPAAVARIFEAKGRPTNHPLIVHLGHPEQLADWAQQPSPAAVRLAEQFWPGPLTLVLRRHPRVPLAVTGGLATVGVRVPAHPVARSLLAVFGGGIAAPSANRFGSVSPTTAGHVRDELGDAVDFVLDGGPCRVGVESTIVDVSGGAPAILRPGGVSHEDLERVLGHSVPAPTASTVRVPGQHPSHYSPRASVVLVAPDQVVAEARRLRAQGRRVGVLLPGTAAADPADMAEVVITVPESSAEYAHHLYEFLRSFDRRGCEVVVASLPEPGGIGQALRDRLRRAAGSPDAPGSG
ncbi:threonylcarbamoyl-AMP synthase [Natronosporangium hydrolyticum]|uniref:Threonylcarbamoyl-AMP synthase n=1 Tax=Natronosporangium hydrolyticum TaxID=2811111 RepID=A0A895YAW8_9ACTN|nr:L-threonylcarbamoyladenylate synthase [Natronosporangium hydrolyticum]QSB13435.1 threonylcarbamoyl-AMP synthase [Natronosporangium hydrolyticum]